MSIWQKIVLVLVLMVAAAGGGYWFHGKLDDAALKAAADKAVAQATKDMQQRVADEHRARVATETQLAQEQQKTQDLNGKLASTQATADSLQDQINHAQFKPKPRPTVAGSCPGHPVTSPEFLRLYNAASALQPTTGGAGDAGNPGGVPQDLF